MRSSFSRTVASLRQLFFFRIATFSEWNFYGAPSSREKLTYFILNLFRIKISTEQLLLEADTFTRQQLFQNRYFLNKGTFSKRGTSSHWDIMLIYYCIISLVFYLHVFQNSYFLEKANFSKKQYSVLPTPSGELFFSEGLLFKTNLFRRGTTTVPFYSSLPVCQLLIKWARYQFHTVKVWEFFLVFLLLLKVAP